MDPHHSKVATAWRSVNAELSRIERAMLEGVSRSRRHAGPVFVWLMLGSLVAYGINLFTPSLSIDEEIYSLRAGPLSQWIEQDRWGMYLVSHALPMPVLPYISLLIGLAANALAAVLAVSLMGVSSNLRAVGAGLLAVTTPVLCFVMHFDTSQFGFFTGLFLGVCSIAMLTRGGLWLPAVGWVVLVMAVSVYQAVSMVALVVYLGWLLNRRILTDDDRSASGPLIRQMLVFGMWFGSALAAHKASALAARALFAPSGGYAAIDSIYSQSFLTRYDPAPGIAQMGRVLAGGAWYMGWQTPVLIGACAIVVLARLAGLRRPAGVRLIGVGVLASLLIAPFLLPLVTGGSWPTRTLLAVPMMLAVLWFTATGVRARVHMWVLTVAATLCLLHFVVSDNRLMYADHLGWQADRQLGTRLLERLDGGRPVPARRLRLAIVGTPAPATSPVRFREETIGASIFEWNGGNPYRIALVLRFLGAEQLVGTANPEDYRRAIAVAAEMPRWPAPGSVVHFDDGLAVVRFGDPSPNHIGYAR